MSISHSTKDVGTDLLADGWREYPDQFNKHSRCFYKDFETPTRCHGNDDKPMQIKISLSNGYAGGVSMELELRAELKDETWLIIQNYSLPKTVKEVTALIPRMLSAWESANDHAKREDCIRALKDKHAQYRFRISQLVIDKLEEVHNHIGGVVGYKLNLTADETEHLCREIERA